jgi:hypothetical protein
MKDERREKLPRLQPIDYAFLIGGPVAFLLVAFLGIRTLVGPDPRPDPIPLLREGKITAGMTAQQVLDKLGAPNSSVTNDDGSMQLRYTRTDWSGVTKERNATLAQDEGVVLIGPDGRVVTVRFERIPVPPPSE